MNERITILRKFGLHASAQALQERLTCRTCAHNDSDAREEPCATCRDFARWEDKRTSGVRVGDLSPEATAKLKPCPKCSGSGIDADNGCEDCPECRGTGGVKGGLADLAESIEQVIPDLLKTHPEHHGVLAAVARVLRAHGVQGRHALPDFLREDAPPDCQCDTCGRKSWDKGERGRPCGMSQPSGGRCAGTMSTRGVALPDGGRTE